MTTGPQTSAELYLFDEAVPTDTLSKFQSECRPDKKVKVEDLFKFSRTRGDLQVSLAAAVIALFFLAFFWTQTGWDSRKLPDDFGTYVAYQFGLAEIDGRVTRLGRILKQSWVAPLLCLLVFVPAALWNLRASWKETAWRKRFLLPTSAYFELTKYAAALEYVVYFIGYTLIVPILGYLVSTLILGTYLTWRLGYRSRSWLLTGFVTSFAVVIAFRTFLQIKTPISIWLYDQLPAATRAFMLTYF
ncbi:tripartite tricarboxylate transporter TctB family protein [Algirhabdus cladophorae]|uniref:tripartite tricarboxylate transporter TctB family protein n=1 Tax=Algirhabdus cladophorae TaxID=3377108 RepID=UPI003B849B6F